MYNVQIIPTHNNQTHCQPPFPKNMEFLKIYQQTKIEKTNLPLKSSQKNSNLDSSSTPAKTKEGGERY
jgi:hypothetical protein